MKCVMILGMHRSGTSCLTGIMQGFGVELGAVHTANPYNKKGNREHPAIMQLNEALLASNGGAWDRPVLVECWSDEQAAQRDAIIAEITAAGGDWWGFKDPRSLLTLKFWLPVVRPRYIGTLRSPIKVAQSLNSRSGMPIEQGLELWYQYNRLLLRMLDQRPFPVVNFDLAGEAYLADATSKLIRIGLDAGLRDKAAEFYEVKLVNQREQQQELSALPQKIVDLYTSIRAYT